MKLKIIVPCYKKWLIHQKTYDNVMKLSKHFNADYCFVEGTYIGTNRDYGIDGEHDYYLFIDTDCYSYHPVKHVTQMIQSGFDIVSGLYYDGNGESVCGYLVGDTFVNSLEKIDCIGAGWLLVKSDVFGKMEKPYFRNYRNFKEDIGFCQYAKDLGFKINVDETIVINHEPLTKDNIVSEEKKELKKTKPKNEQKNIRDLSIIELKAEILDRQDQILIYQKEINELRKEIAARN